MNPDPTSTTDHEPDPPGPRVIFEGAVRGGRRVRIVALPLAHRIVVEHESRDALGFLTWRATRLEPGDLELIELLVRERLVPIAEEVERYRHELAAWARTLPPQESQR